MATKSFKQKSVDSHAKRAAKKSAELESYRTGRERKYRQGYTSNGVKYFKSPRFYDPKSYAPVKGYASPANKRGSIKNQTMVFSKRTGVSGYSSRNTSQVDGKTSKSQTKSSNRTRKPTYRVAHPNLSMKKLSMLTQTAMHRNFNDFMTSRKDKENKSLLRKKGLRKNEEYMTEKGRENIDDGEDLSPFRGKEEEPTVQTYRAKRKESANSSGLMTSVPRKINREAELERDKLNYASMPKSYGAKYNPVSPHTSKNATAKYTKFDLAEEEASLREMKKSLEREKKLFMNFTGPIKLEHDSGPEDDESQIVRKANKSLLGSKFSSNRANLNKTSKLASTNSSNVLELDS